MPFHIVTNWSNTSFEIKCVLLSTKHLASAGLNHQKLGRAHIIWPSPFHTALYRTKHSLRSCSFSCTVSVWIWMCALVVVWLASWRRVASIRASFFVIIFTGLDKRVDAVGERPSVGSVALGIAALNAQALLQSEVERLAEPPWNQITNRTPRLSERPWRPFLPPASTL